MPKEDPMGPGGGAGQGRTKKSWPKKKKSARGQVWAERKLDVAGKKQSDSEVKGLKKMGPKKTEPIKAFITRRNKKSGKK